MDLVKYPDPLLKAACEEIADFGEQASRTADEMLELMYRNKGLGLAGPQAGLSRKIVVINPSGKQKDEIILINPEIISYSGGDIRYEEGCLSFPGIFAKITRPEKISCVARLLDGREVSFDCDGLLARIVQHEVDHLEGVLLNDRMSPVERKVHQRELRKLRKDFRG